MNGPIFIVGAPRSGGVALAHGMSLIPEVMALGIDREAVDPDALTRPDGDRRSPEDAPAAAEALRRTLEIRAIEALEEIRVQAGGGPTEESGSPDARLVVLLEGASLQISFLAAALPEARFVLVHRDPISTVPEIVADWSAATDENEEDVPGARGGPPWRYDLIPAWAGLAGASAAEIAVAQWTAITGAALDDLERLAPKRWCVVGHDALAADGRPELERICAFLGVDPGGDLAGPASRIAAMLNSKQRGSSTPELARLLPRTAAVAERAAELLPTAPAAGGRAGRSDLDRDSPLRSVHTASFAELLEEAGSSLLVSTYHAGSLICLRPDRSRVNTHFRELRRPMGMAVAPGRLSVGSQSEVIEYRDMPEAAPRLEPEGTHDACFLPRRVDLTGDISVHDVAYAGGETWVVATRFSCLATLDGEHSFVPRWSPEFITELAPEDRCHLNGLCVADDEVAYVTALGRSDESGGWRDHRADGGLLIDVRSGETVIGDLSMPHSPRMHNGRLWLLESGRGTICAVDPVRGERETVAELPGFTRGLAFIGPYALVGLSKIRETSTFGGLPITERLSVRKCGVWVVDTRDGEIAGFLRFEDLVQEIYDLAVLEGLRMPEIADAGSSASEGSFDLPA